MWASESLSVGNRPVWGVGLGFDVGDGCWMALKKLDLGRFLIIY